MADQFYSYPKVSKRLHFGPLADHIDSFAQILKLQGYKTNTTKQKIRIAANLRLSNGMVGSTTWYSARICKVSKCDGPPNRGSFTRTASISLSSEATIYL